MSKSMKGDNLLLAGEEEKQPEGSLNDHKFGNLSRYQSEIQKSNHGDNVTNKQY